MTYSKLMNKTTLDLLEQKAYEEALEASRMCDAFAEEWELPTDYVYMEFVNPEVANLEEVVKALDVDALFVYGE